MFENNTYYGVAGYDILHQLSVLTVLLAKIFILLIFRLSVISIRNYHFLLLQRVGKNICKSHIHQKSVSRIYIEFFKKKNKRRIMGKHLNNHSSKKIWCSTLVIREIQSKSLLRWNTPIRKAWKKQNKMDSTRTCKYCESGYKVAWSLWKTVWQFHVKLNIHLPYDPAIPLWGFYPTEMRT